MARSFSTQLPKMHLACSDDELRPTMTHILFTKEEIVASDATILVIHKTKDYLDKEFIKSMPERFLISRWNYLILSKRNAKIKYDKVRKLIIVTDLKYTEHYVPVIPDDGEKFNKYPDYEKVFPEKSHKIINIGINGKRLENLYKSMLMPYQYYYPLIFEFCGVDKAIKVTVPCSNAIGIIMPQMINK